MSFAGPFYKISYLLGFISEEDEEESGGQPRGDSDTHTQSEREREREAEVHVVRWGGPRPGGGRCDSLGWLAGIEKRPGGG